MKKHIAYLFDSTTQDYNYGGTSPLEKCLPSLKKSVAHSVKLLCIYFPPQKTLRFILLSQAGYVPATIALLSS